MIETPSDERADALFDICVHVELLLNGQAVAIGRIELAR